MTFLYILLIILLCAVLVKSADIAIKALVFFSNYLKLSKFVIAFILAGIATSFPEILVSISSGIHKCSTLALGNILGSNIADITLILGLTIILVKGLKTEAKVIQTNIFYTLLLVIYPIILLLDGTLSRTDGLALIGIFLIYLLILFRQKEKFTQTYETVRRKKLLENILLFVVGMILLVLSADTIVKISNILAVRLNTHLIIIGLFLIAVGTSLPELAFGLRAAKLQSKEMVLGNVLGSLVVNSTLALGITSIISPIVIQNPPTFLTSACFMLVGLALFAIFSRTQRNLTKKEGVILLFFYITFVIVQHLIG